MTTINPESQIVASRYDEQNRICFYTYQHSDGSSYTIEVPLDDLQKIGTTPATKDARRRHLAHRILTHIQTNPPDEAQQPEPSNGKGPV